MLAILALILFIVAAVLNGHVDSWSFWMLIGLAALAAHIAFAFWGPTYYRAPRR